MIREILTSETLAVATVAGVGLGVLSAVHRNRAADYAAVLFSTTGAAVPGCADAVVPAASAEELRDDRGVECRASFCDAPHC